MNARLVAAVAVLAVALAGCGERVDAGERAQFVVREADYQDRYGRLGFAPLAVVSRGTTYHVAMASRIDDVLGIDSAGGFHEPRDEGCTLGERQPFTVCRTFVLPQDTELVGFVLRDVYWPVN